MKCNSCGRKRRYHYHTKWGEKICLECLRMAESVGLISTETI